MYSGKPRAQHEQTAVNAAVNRFPHLSVPPGMPIETYITNRMARWALWHIWVEGLLSGSPGPKRVCSWWGPLWSARIQNPGAFSRRVLDTCPVSIEEAEETDRAFQVMIEADKPREVKYNRILVLCYLTTFTAKQKAKAMAPSGCFQTYYNRLARAHEEMLQLLDDMAGGALQAPVDPKALVATMPSATSGLTAIGM